MLIEAYVTSPAEAEAAERAGAGRIELCGPGEGGLTPSRADVERTLRAVSVPVHVMIRPREGNFRYSEIEFDAMRRAVEWVSGSGAAGVVFGVLRPDRTLDIPRMQELITLAWPLRIACHRAFDATPDADAALDVLLALGVDLVLTSGHAPTALEGAETLARHVHRAAGRLTVLAGGSVRAENVRDVVARSGVHEVHARGTKPQVISEIVGALG